MSHTLHSDTDLLAELVGFPSVSDQSNRPIAEFVADYLDQHGVRVQLLPTADAQKVNLLAAVGPESNDDRGGLLLSGHMDVVPADEPQWQGDPFKLRESDDRLVGRGSCDMKASLAIFMNLAIEAAAAGSLQQPLALLFSADEEVGSLGVQHLVTHDAPHLPPLPRRAIIGEPTSLAAICCHKGHLKATLTITGTAAHSGSPHLGVNATDPLAELLTTLRELQMELRRQPIESAAHFPAEVAFPMLNVVNIRAGVAGNVIPDRCDVQLSIRLLPGMQSNPIVERLDELCNQLSGRFDGEVQITSVTDNPPLDRSSNGSLHQALCDLLKQQQPLAASFASDGGHLSRGLQMECVLFGPGSIEVAHKPEEFVPISEISAARTTLQRLVHIFCGDAAVPDNR